MTSKHVYFVTLCMCVLLYETRKYGKLQQNGEIPNLVGYFHENWYTHI